MLRLPNLIAHFLRVLLLVVVTTPQLSFADQTSYIPCTQFLRTITEAEDLSYIELYEQSLIFPKQAEQQLPKLTKKIAPKALRLGKLCTC